MEEKKYEGVVQITAAEYRELITQAVEAEKNYEAARSAKWNLESEVSALKNELAETQKELDAYKKQFAALHSYAQYTGKSCGTTDSEHGTCEIIRLKSGGINHG